MMPKYIIEYIANLQGAINVLTPYIQQQQAAIWINELSMRIKILRLQYDTTQQ